MAFKTKFDKPTGKDLDDLIEPVCTLAELDVTDWHPDFRELIRSARFIKEKYGFEVEVHPRRHRR